MEKIPLSIRDNLYIEAQVGTPAKRTAQSLFKIIQFLFYRVPYKDKKQFFSRVRGKIMRIPPTEVGMKKLPPSASIGQAVSLSKNLLSGLNVTFVDEVLKELVKLLTTLPGYV
jgi:hypothetical protein